MTKQIGIHSILETNGSGGDRLSHAGLEVGGLVLLDLKTWDPERAAGGGRASVRGGEAGLNGY